jgi:hypothetical protein
MSPSPDLPKESIMKTSRIALATAVLATAAFGALADEADGSQYAVQFNGAKTRAEVQAELAQYKQAGVNPWSTQYNPLNSFRGAKTRAQVTGEYLASRDAVAAFTSEDSGSTYLAARKPVATTRFAGQPATGAAE